MKSTQVVNPDLDDPPRSARPTTPSASPASTIRGKIVTMSSVTRPPTRHSTSTRLVHLEQPVGRRNDNPSRRDVHRAERLHEGHEHIPAFPCHDQPRRPTVNVNRPTRPTSCSARQSDLASNELVHVVHMFRQQILAAVDGIRNSRLAKTLGLVDPPTRRRTPRAAVPRCIRNDRTVRSSGSAPAARHHTRAPTANRSSAKSVVPFTTTSPLIPCVRATTPTSIISSQGSPGALPSPRRVPDIQLDALGVDIRGRRHQRAQGRGRPPLAPDHSTEIARGHEEFEVLSTPPLRFGHLHDIGLVGQRAGDDFDQRFEFGHVDLPTPGARWRSPRSPAPLPVHA